MAKIIPVTEPKPAQFLVIDLTMEPERIFELVTLAIGIVAQVNHEQMKIVEIPDHKFHSDKLGEF